MKKIKTKDIDPSKLITKSQYAKDKNIQPMQVTRMIQSGKLTIVVARGGELIHL